MLGLSNGLIWRNRVKAQEPFFDPNVITTEVIPDSGIFQSDCVAWYDFTDQSSMFKDNSGLNTISPNENIGRIENKGKAIRKIGNFLRGNWNEVGGDGTALNPTFKLNGVNGYSYGDFDSTATYGFGQGLSGSDYYSFGYGSSKGHGGGCFLNVINGSNFYTYNNDGYYPSLQPHGLSSSPNNNWFSDWAINNNATTVFWVIKPSTADPSGTGLNTHWVVKPDYDDDAGAAGRGEETYLEACTKASSDEFELRYNNEQEGASGTTYVSSGDDVTSDVRIFMGVFDDGDMYFSVDGSGAIDTETISTQVVHNMKTGMLAIGQWPLGNVHSGIVSGSAYDGEFYELIMFQKALSGTEIGVVYGALFNKYS